MTMQTNPMKCSYRNNLGSQFDAASCSLVGFGSKSIVGPGLIASHLPVPC
ncbi:hypothetical protein WA016_01827 [Myxococcus stipitatus]